MTFRPRFPPMLLTSTPPIDSACAGRLRIGVLGLLALLASGCTEVRLISDYDEQTDAQ